MGPGDPTFGPHLEHKYIELPNHLPSLKMPFWVDLRAADKLNWEAYML